MLHLERGGAAGLVVVFPNYHCYMQDTMYTALMPMQQKASFARDPSATRCRSFTSRDPLCAMKAMRLPTSDCLGDRGFARHQSVRRRSRSKARRRAQSRQHTQHTKAKYESAKSKKVHRGGVQSVHIHPLPPHTPAGRCYNRPTCRMGEYSKNECVNSTI